MDITSHGLTETEMIRITQLKLPCGHAEGALEEKTKKILRLSSNGASHTGFSYSLVRHSVDARKKPQLFDIYTVDVETGLSEKDETALVRRLKDKNISIAPKESYVFPVSGREALPHRPVVIGAGPAGLFCALFLAEHGYRPLLIERGKPMEERAADVARFWEDGVLDPASNVQFGEGGAGTFSDGKLNTQINDKTGRSRKILETFVEAGASPSILYDAKPHIGTDRLRTVIPNIRRRIEEAGGEVLFDTICTGFSFKKLQDSSLGAPEAESSSMAEKTGKEIPAPTYLDGVFLQNTSDVRNENPSDGHRDEWFVPAEAVVLAIGHSARDTVEYLYRTGLPMEQKQFAVGFRVAHPQKMIDQSQYGISDPDELASMGLSASPYKLTAKAGSGRGVYSFCMCPGGLIVNASSEDGGLCVNGMSNEKRDSGWANSAVVVTVGEKEFGSSDVLAGMHFQRRLEKKAYELGGGRIPAQRYVDLRREILLSEISCPKDFKDTQALSGSKDLKDSRSMSCPDDLKDAQGMSVLRDLNDSRLSPCRLPCGWSAGSYSETTLKDLLPQDLTLDFIEGMEQFGHRISGFDGPQAIVAGVESRTSSPVRILRGETFESTGVHGLYPCGEGAGYAGGIMSAAMDGMRIAEAIAGRYTPLNQGKEIQPYT